MKEIDNASEISTGKVLLDFHAAWCGPCKNQSPILAAFAASRDDVEVLKVDVDSDIGQHLSAEFKVRGIPTLITLFDGCEIQRTVGLAQMDKLNSMVEAL